MSNKAFSKYFYEQCAGAFAGHMGMVPNNPTLFGLVKAYSSGLDSHYAATQTEFSAMLRNIANELDPPAQNK